MKKREFVQVFILPYLGKDKPRNRQLWNDQLDYCIQSGLIPESAERWVKVPKNKFGEV